MAVRVVPAWDGWRSSGGGRSEPAWGRLPPCWPSPSCVRSWLPAQCRRPPSCHGHSEGEGHDESPAAIACCAVVKSVKSLPSAQQPAGAGACCRSTRHRIPSRTSTATMTGHCPGFRRHAALPAARRAADLTVRVRPAFRPVRLQRLPGAHDRAPTRRAVCPDPLQPPGTASVLVVDEYGDGSNECISSLVARLPRRPPRGTRGHAGRRADDRVRAAAGVSRRRAGSARVRQPAPWSATRRCWNPRRATWPPASGFRK